MGAVLGACSAACCAANLACCCGSAACGLCCKSCPTCRNSTSTRIVYSLFLLFGLIASCITLIPGIREKLNSIPQFCEVSSGLNNCFQRVKVKTKDALSTNKVKNMTVTSSSNVESSLQKISYRDPVKL